MYTLEMAIEKTNNFHFLLHLNKFEEKCLYLKVKLGGAD